MQPPPMPYHLTKRIASNTCKGSFFPPVRFATTIRGRRPLASSPEDFSHADGLLQGAVAYRHDTTGKIRGGLLPLTPRTCNTHALSVPVRQLHGDARFAKSRDDPRSAANDGRRKNQRQTGEVSGPSFVMGIDGHAYVAAKQHRVVFRRSRKILSSKRASITSIKAKL